MGFSISWSEYRKNPLPRNFNYKRKDLITMNYLKKRLSSFGMLLLLLIPVLSNITPREWQESEISIYSITDPSKDSSILDDDLEIIE